MRRSGGERGCALRALGAGGGAGESRATVRAGKGKGDTTIVERPAAPATSHHGYYHHAASLPPSLATTTVSPSMLMVHELARHRAPPTCTP